MPRRSFVLLVVVILAGLWTPPQRTQAQTGCPEGGCKVFLPVVHTPQYVRVIRWGWYADFGRYIWCENPTAFVEFQNVSNEIVTGISIRVRGALEDGTDVSVDAERSDLTVFPGDVGWIEYSITHPSDVLCSKFNGTFDADISITNVVLARTQD